MEWRVSGFGEVLGELGGPALAYVQAENGGAWAKVYDPPSFAEFAAPSGVDAAKAWAVDQLPVLVVVEEAEPAPRPRKRKAAE